MKAVQLHEYGGPEKLMYEDVPTPEPGPDEVMLRVISTSVNPVDFKIRKGELKAHMPVQFPVILGRDVAGEVVRVGLDVTRWKRGDLLMGLVNRSYAEFLTARADALARIPEGLDPKDAGALPLILETGAQLIEKGIQPHAGETILVTGAAGSVGRAAVYVAKQHGAHVIAGVRGSQKAEMQGAGADSLVALDDDAEIAGLPELDAIADTVGGETIMKVIPKLKKSGRIASVVGKPEAPGIDVRVVWAQPDPERLYKLAEDVRDGRLTIPVSKRMRLEDIREAHKAAEHNAGGKIELLP